MIKCTDTKFTDTSPTTFFRRNKKDKYQEEERDITETQIMEKLELIVISMRQEAAKASSYFQYQKNQLQSKVNKQQKIIDLFEEQNNMLRELISTYVQKYGQIEGQNAEIQKIQIMRRQLQQDSEENTNTNYINIKSERKPNDYSKMSTNYISKYQHSQNRQSLYRMQDQQKQTSHSQCNAYQSQKLSCWNSSGSNFYKKPYYNDEITLKGNAQSSVRNIPQLSKHPSEQMSEISHVQTVQTSVNHFSKKPQQSMQIMQIDNLGLESKGCGFFKSIQIHHYGEQDLNQTLLIENSQIQYKQHDTKFKTENEFNEDNTSFNPLKTDSDIKRMRQVLYVKYEQSTVQPVQINEDYEDNSGPIQLPISNNNMNQLKTLNHSYFKRLNFYQQRTHKNDKIRDGINYCQKQKDQHEIQNMRNELKVVQRKLKALFEPLPSNIESKKISLPKMNQQIKKLYARQSINLQRLNELFNPVNTRQLKSQMIFSRENKQNKKRTNLNKRIL